ncbi:MAG: hypothetical protein ACQER9_02650 [Nanobdellota archaeon]
MGRKGQTNLEFIVILAVVITIAIISYIAVGGMPSLSEEMKERSYNKYWESSDISVIAKRFNGSEGRISLYNNMEDIIIVKSFRIDDIKVDVNDKTLKPGEKSVFSFDYNYDGKKDYKFPFVVNYNNIVNGKKYSFYGKAPLSGTLSQ